MDISDEMDREDFDRLADLVVERWESMSTVGPHDRSDPVRDSVLRTMFITWGLLWYGTPDERAATRRALHLPPESGLVAG